MPQESSIIPLFKRYIIDIKKKSQFANEIVVWVTGKDLATMKAKMNSKLNKIEKYLYQKIWNYRLKMCISNKI